MLEEFTVRHPPADLLVASYFEYKPGGKPNRKQAARENASALSAIPPKMMAASMKSIDQMPAFVRSPEMLEVMAKLRANG